MGKKSKKKGYEDIPIDIEESVVCNLIEAQASVSMSSPSFSFLRKAVKRHRKGKLKLDGVYKAFGQAMFNEIMIEAIMQRIADEGIEIVEIIDDN